MRKVDYDVMIIGAGPAGLTSALYLGRANLSIAVVDKGMLGGQIQNTSAIENYPGFKEISGEQLADNMVDQLTNYPIDFIFDQVTGVSKNDDGTFNVVFDPETVYTTQYVILATGTSYKTLDVAGETEFLGKGVSYCALCDGAFFKDKPIVVVGAGDSAVEEAIFLTRYASKVTILNRGASWRAKSHLVALAEANPKIEMVYNSQVTAIAGDVTVSKVILEDGRELAVSGIFIYIGQLPNNGCLGNGISVKADNSFIVTNDNCETETDGLYVVGDLRAKPLRQIVTAISDGAIAANHIMLRSLD